MLANPIFMENRLNNHIANRTISSLESIIDDAASIYNQSQSAATNPSFTELDILSATSYPLPFLQSSSTTTRQSKRKADEITTNVPQLGGLLFPEIDYNSENLSSSAEVDEESRPQRPKKKSKKVSIDKDADGDTDNDEASGKRQRGRPRLETQDETAADRRRTQIRLAQRAYRHRKESTIASLKKRTKELKNAILQMDQVFSSLHDDLLNSGLLNTDLELVQQLRQANNRFTASVDLAADSEAEDDEKGATTTGNERDISEENSDQQKSPPRPSRGSRSDEGKREKDRSKNRSFEDADVEELPAVGNSAKQNSTYSPPQDWFSTDTLTQFNVQTPEKSISWSELVGSNNDLLDPNFVPFTTDLSLAYPMYFDVPVERSLRAPDQPQGLYTYSFQETSFARRLHRLTMERNFRKLCNLYVDPEYIKRVYRFTFCFNNRDRLIKGIGEKLTRKAGESLENWNAPYFHIGGAGLHFPRRDEITGEPIYPPNMFSPAKAFGPRQFINIETPRDEASLQESLEALGFGGQWFDSHDVEEYLKTKGIFLDATSTFVDVSPTLIESTSATQVAPSLTNGSRSPTTSSDGNSMIQSSSPPLSNSDAPVIHENNLAFNPQQQQYTLGGQSFDKDLFPESQYADASDPSWSNLFSQPMDFETSFPIQNQNMRTLDVDLFLDRMVEGGSCLGRAPGFRKEWVDRALETSLLEVC